MHGAPRERGRPLAAPMYRLTVRRHQANEQHTRHDFVIDGDSLPALLRTMQDILRTAQAERGKGVWSSTDPEIWIGGHMIRRLGQDSDPAQLARCVTDSLSPPKPAAGS